MLQLGETTPSTWTQYPNPSSVKFSSKPNCALIDNVKGPHQFLVAGVGVNSELYVGTFVQEGNPGMPINPHQNTNFAAIGSYTYPVGPELASATSGSKGAVVVTLVTAAVNGSQQIHAYVASLPYTNTWSSRIDGPVLPQGYSVVGGPAMVSYPFAPGLFGIVVHTTNGGDEIFHTYFHSGFNGGSTGFSSATGVLQNSWTQITGLLEGLSISGAPSLTYDSAVGVETLYFRDGYDIMETSGAPPGISSSVNPLGDYPVDMILPELGFHFNYGPAAVGNTPFGSQAPTENGLAVDTYGNVYMINALPDDDLGP